MYRNVIKDLWGSCNVGSPMSTAIVLYSIILTHSAAHRSASPAHRSPPPEHLDSLPVPVVPSLLARAASSLLSSSSTWRGHFVCSHRVAVWRSSEISGCKSNEHITGQCTTQLTDPTNPIARQLLQFPQDHPKSLSRSNKSAPNLLWCLTCRMPQTMIMRSEPIESYRRPFSPNTFGDSNSSCTYLRRCIRYWGLSDAGHAVYLCISGPCCFAVVFDRAWRSEYMFKDLDPRVRRL